MLVNKLRELFVHFDDTYNSKIFSKHLCDQVDISDNVLSRILDGLYTTEDGSIQYDFSLIDADVLGNIYEQYLGHILKKTEKRTKLTESKAKRKEEGIYYTPSYIVDYIVRNTVGELVKNKKTDVSKIKVLDPACGSGSFLIKTFDVLNEYHSKKEGYSQNKLDMSGTGTTYSTKLSILRDNIFGVDLDKQAVDIAQLNLLLKVAEKKRRLPILQQNIKNGNSLIDDPNLAGDKAFKWNEEFAEIMNNGGFDIIIANPPYVRADIDDLEYKTQRKWILDNDKYKILFEKWDLYLAFVVKSLYLLRNDGLFGMILPDAFCTSKYASKMRQFLCDNKQVMQIDYFPTDQIFKGVGVKNIILFFKNTAPYTKTAKIIHSNITEVVNKSYVNLKKTSESGFRINYNIKMKMIYPKSELLGDICYISKGMVLNSDEIKHKGEFEKDDLISDFKSQIHKKWYVEAKNVGRYSINKIRFLEWDTNRVPSKISRKTFPELYLGEKLIKGRMTDATFDDSKILNNDSLYDIKRFCDLKGIENKSINNSIKKWTDKSREELEKISYNFDLKYILAILNSKWCKEFLSRINRSSLSIYPDDIKKIPIKELPKMEQKKIIDLVEKILFLNKKYNQFGSKNTDEQLQISKEIIEIDETIDNIIYRQYNVAEKEKKVIEESIK